MKSLNRLFKSTYLVLFALFISLTAYSQNTDPCDCTQRWEGGAHWNPDGSIDDSPNAPLELGIIRCGSSAETQSQVSPLSGCTYDSSAFKIDVQSFPCVDPSTGNVVFPLNPTQGEPIVWLNFDVRPDAGSFQIQINDGNENVAWALYHSDIVTYGVSPNPNGLGNDSTSGSCSNLTLVACGVESSNSFSTLPVPNFSQAANYYIAIWDQDADGSISLGNFKARYGCGDTDILLCNISVDTPVNECDSSGTYTLKIPINGINGEFYAYDPNSNNAGGLSLSVCLTNPGETNPVTSDTLVLTYNQSTPYNVIIFEANDSLAPTAVVNGACADPLNPEGCRDTISGPAPNCCILTVSTTSTDVDCNGANNGSALAVDAGGATPVTYLWSDSQTTQTASGLAPGTYTVTVTDANQCTASATAVITEPTALNVQCVITSNVSCNGGSDGFLSSNVTGGTLSYSYQWSSGSSLADASNLIAGTYTLVVTDGNGCIDSCTATVTEPPALTCSIIGSDPLCNGDATGSATVTVGGGTPGYSYAWSDGQSTSLATGLSAGTYTVTITDANQCTSTCTVTLGEPSTLSCSTQGVDPLCNGGSDGSATVSGSGGTSPYTYAWSNGQTGASASGLTAGTYTATVTDANQCTSTCTVTLGEPTAIQISLVPANSTCGFANGAVAATISGGTPGYTYSWNNGASTEDISSVIAGTYQIIVTDSNGCQDSASASVNDIGGPSVTASGTDVLCNGGNTGTATASPSGGTSPYSYAWSNGQSTQTATGLVAGTYTITVTDSNQCQASTAVTINEPSALSCSTQGTDPLCNGSSDGSATVNGSGGTSPYTYAWSNGQTGASASGLSAGTYTATVTDANQCTSTCTVTLGEPSTLSCSTQGVDPLCNGGSDGSATVSGSGGTSPYSYAWSNGQTGSSATGLTAGTYTATVTDANQCTSTCTVTLGEPSTLSCSTQGVDPLCNSGSDGSATVSGSGGTSPYTYAWSNGQTGAGASGLTAGTYTATVTDANQCTSTCTVTLGEPTAIQISLVPANSTCGFANGSVDATISGGTPTYSYSWNNGSTMEDISGVIAGTYQIIVTDSNGCQDSASASVNDIGGPSVTVSGTDVLCNGGNTGTATANASSGTSPYTYVWSDGQTTQTATSLTAGTYTVTVFDANQCQASTTIVVNEPIALNCTASGTDPLCNGDSTGTATVNVAGGIGSYMYMWSNGQTTQNVSGLIAGTYSVIVMDQNYCSDTCSITLNDPALLSCTATGVDVLCNGGNDGSASVSVSGGTPVPIIYKTVEIDIHTDNFSVETTWELKSHLTGQVLMSGGPYLNNNTLYKHSTQAFEGDSLCFIIYDSFGDGICCLQGQGYCAVAIEGVTISVGGQFTYQDESNFRVPGALGDPYTYLWSDGQTTSSATGLSAGTYTVIVTDLNQCTTTCSVTINEPTALSLSASPTNTTCSGGNDGALDLSVSGGTPPYAYSWSNGASTEDINSLAAGLYTVTVTDANQCTSETIGFVGGGAALQLNANVIDVNCNGFSNGSIDITVSGGVTPYSYNWSNGANTEDIFGLLAGTYTVTVSDSSGCVTSGSWNVNEPQPLTINCSVLNPVSCFGGTDGAVVAAASGGTAPYCYSWVFTTSSGCDSTLSNLGMGTYTVIVTDANQCTATCTVSLTEPPELLLTKTDTFCFIEYNIDNYQHGAELTSVVAGDVTVSITAIANQGRPDKVIVFNSDLTGTPDPDLEVGLGNLMILPDDDVDGNGDFLVDNPNDNQFGGKMIFNFSDNVKVKCFKYVDQDDSSPSYAKAYDSANNLISTITINNGGNGSVQLFAMNADNVSRLEFELAGSGAIAELQIECPSSVGQGATGSIDLTVSGGTPAYNYQWSNGASTQDISNVPAGFYTVTVTDANGCSKTCSTLLSSPNLPIATCQVTRQITCNGGNDGEVTVAVIGGQAPYNIQWSTGANGNVITNCTAGTYTITVTDANGFISTETMVLGEPVAIDNNINTSDATSFCAGGSALLVAPYDPDCSYQWLRFGVPISGETNPTYVAVGTGGYKVRITNSTGCVKVSNKISVVKYDKPNALITPMSSTTICPGTDIILSANTGQGLNYTWKFRGSVQSESTSNFSATKAGGYVVIVTDANGCTRLSNKVYVSKHPRPRISLDQTGQINICQGSTLQLTALPTNSPGPYTFEWFRYNNLISGVTGANYTVTFTGGYSARVIDANGCTNKTPRTVVTAVSCTPRVIDPSLDVFVYPNPFNHVLHVNVKGNSEKPLQVVIYNVLGEVVYEQDYANIYALTQIDLNHVLSGMYMMKVTQGDEETHIKINKTN